MPKLEIDRNRLLARHEAMAAFGATGRGGVDRPALGPAETQARGALLDWARARGFRCAVDPIGNLLIRRSGLDETAAPVRTGSHLDSQTPGGNYDGVYGVLAGFEVLETLEDAGFETLRPVEVMVWNNEEGVRFAPTTMGSAVHAGAIPLAVALDRTDQDGISVQRALADSFPRLGALVQVPLKTPAYAYVEAHIEQGPLLEAQGKTIGIVSGIQGVVQFTVSVFGKEMHAGTTPRRNRKDALLGAIEIMARFHDLANDPEDQVRFTVGRMTVRPGAPNTVPSEVVFSIDLRHPVPETLAGLRKGIEEIARAGAPPCAVTIVETLNSPPVRFDARLVDLVGQAALKIGAATLELHSGATHDAKFMAALCPTTMIFIPCREGLSHNEAEWAELDHMIAGANVLLSVIRGLADEHDQRQ